MCNAAGWKTPMLEKMLFRHHLVFLMQVPSHTVNAASNGPIVGLESSLVQKSVGMAIAPGVSSFDDPHQKGVGARNELL